MLDIQKRLTKSFYILLSLPATAMGFALSVQISALSWILATKYQLDIHDIGLVWAAGPIAGILGQVIVGVISDKVWFWNGRRRGFILIGGVLSSLMLLALPNIDVISSALGLDGILGVALAIALTLDLAINISFNPTRSIIADVTPEGSSRTKGYTWMQTVSGTFGVLAYAVGAIWNNYALIYAGVVLVLIFSIIPTFFIKEPRQLNGAEDAVAAPSFSFGELMRTIRPLMGFLLYSIYAMGLRISGAHFDHYYVEIALFLVTMYFLGQALFTSEKGKSSEEASDIGFKKILAAHAFTWLGVQTMFVYMFSYVQHAMPTLSDLSMGRVVSISFLILSAVGAALPALVLEPITERIGRVKTHLICIAIMALGYAGILLAGTTPTMIYLLMGVLGIGWAATVSLPFAIMSQKVNSAKMGLYMGIFNLAVVFPQLVASLGIGELVSAAPNKNIIFIICTASLAASAFSWAMVSEK
jgi:maltose/moltooligosaccharide transporter